MKRLLLVLALCIGVAGSGSARADKASPRVGGAQSGGLVQNPTGVSFLASPDHNAVDPFDGLPVLTEYRLNIYAEAAPSGPALSYVSLGKPQPNAQGLIDIAAAPAMFSGAPTNTRLVAKIAAIGPGGTSESGVSNPFVVVVKRPPAAPGSATVK